MKKYALLIILLFGQYTIYAQIMALDTIWVKRYGWVYQEGTNDLILQFIYPNGEDRVSQYIREDITKKFFKTNSVLSLDESCEELLKNSFNYLVGETYLHRYSAIKFVNNKVLDFIISHDRSVGCGDGTRSYSYCYSLFTGNRITIDSLFCKSTQSTVIKLLQSRYDDYYEKRSEEDRKMHRHIEHLNNFILLPKGLMFIYNPYEIGFGYESGFRYTVKFSEIKYLLKPQAIGYFFE
ncbi:DUF3298 domain-containing protein [Alistipes dispar]|uniref:DUF3298 domain-containing protein n=1 Tax=Alistipes dispar TaxID=2585119 RepID=UPI003A8947D9